MDPNNAAYCSESHAGGESGERVTPTLTEASRSSDAAKAWGMFLRELFIAAALQAGCEDLKPEDMRIDPWPPGQHHPSPLSSEEMAVYVFTYDGTCLKVGKVGPNSRARFTSHHYQPGSSRSNLAKSLSTGGWADVPGAPVLNDDTAGQWIKDHTMRVNFILPKSWGVPVLNLLEAFLQCRLRPRFEGFESQRIKG